MQLCPAVIGFWSGFWVHNGEKVVGSAVKIAVIATAYVILRFIIFRLLNRLTKSLLHKVGGELTEARQARLRALRSALSSGCAFVLGLVAATMVLQAAGINIVPLITTASVAGLAVGFGAQKLVRDVIAGLFMLVEDQYGVGDFVTIGTATGVVEELGMRVTRIRDKSGKLWIISNGDIGQVCNHSRGDFMMSHDVSVPSASDLEKARGVLDEVGREIASDRPEMVRSPLTCDGLASVTAAAAVLRVRGVVDPSCQDEVNEELNQRIHDAFAKNNLTLS
jgi:moderate conductance mechanosensitive channel